MVFEKNWWIKSGEYQGLSISNRNDRKSLTGTMLIIILIMLTVLHRSTEDSGGKAEDEIKSLSDVKNGFEIGDSVSIFSKNSSSDAQQPDVFDRYLSSHVIRIKSPFDESKFYDFELKHLIQEDTVEGRKKRLDGLMRFLLPIFVAIKMKLHSLVVLMTFVAGIAIKGFVAGATALILSKLIGLKLLLQKREEEEKEENDHHEGEQDEEAEKPIVVFLNSDQKWARNGFEKQAALNERYYPYNRKWDKYENVRRQRWSNFPYRRHQPWS